METLLTIIITLNLLIMLKAISLTYNLIYPVKKSKPKQKPKISYPDKMRKLASAKNSIAVNSVVDQQKIRTAEIEIPVIAEDVLSYEGGELGAAYPEPTNLFYPESAIKDPEYLETVMRSPFQVQTHQKNTTEYNRDVNGWPTKVWFDDTTKKVMVKGFLHGEENVKYVEDNKGKPGFGTSAFISFLQIDRTPGTAPNGKPYDAIVRKAVNNHVAILPGIRDQNNVIVAMNAVEEKKIDDSLEKDTTANSAEKPAEVKKMPIEKSDFKEAMQAYMADEAEEKEKADKIKNAIKNELKEEEGKEKPKTENAEEDKKEDKKEEKTENAEDKKDEASNALPSEEMIKDFSTNLGVTFAKVPSLGQLAALVGINAKNPAELISALNAKREEFKTKIVKTEASNSNSTIADVMASM